jgi:RimJ/RimL family protein N-acetyltransferase
VRLDPLRVEDAAEMAAVLADPALYTVIGGAPPTEAELAERYAFQLDGHPEWVNRVVRVDGRAVGYVQATVYPDDRAALAWVIGTAHQGRGYATAAARALVAELGAELGVGRVEAWIAPGHRPSERVAEHLGLHPTGEVDEDGEQRWSSGEVPV